MNRLLISSLAFALLTLGATAPAQPITVFLSDSEVAALPPSARERYIQAREDLNFIRHHDAVDGVIEAARRAPQAVELNLLAAEAAGRWGDIRSGDESRQYFRTGIELLEGIQSVEMGGTNRTRLENQLARQRESLQAVGSRDDDRMATGFRLMMTIRRERLQRAVRDSDEGARVLLGRDRRAEERGESDYEERAGQIWPQLAAPGRYVPPRFPPNQLGGGQFGFNPMMGGGQFGFDPMMGAEFGGAGGGFGGGDPFAAGGDPFAGGGDPFGGGGGGGFGGDPFGGGGGGGFGGDPFGGGGAGGGFGGDPFGGGGGQNPFIDGGGQK